MPETTALISDELKQWVRLSPASKTGSRRKLSRKRWGGISQNQRLKETFAFGEAHARKHGVKPEDVDAIVREERDRSKLAR